MKIENQALVLTVAGVPKRIDLPAIARDAVVTAWAVPSAYRESGVFMAVTERGQVPELPACNPQDAQPLGQVDYPAGDAARLAAAKAQKLAAINAQCDAAVAQMVADYPDQEVLSWPQQVKEAMALEADAQAPAPLLQAIASARGLELPELAGRVLAKMHAFAVASGALFGRRQAAEDLLGLAATSDDVAAVQW